MIKDLKRQEAETLEDYLWRLGTLKIDKEIENTWSELADMMNEAFSLHYDESVYRKKYKKLQKAFETVEDEQDDSFSEMTQQSIAEMNRQRVRIRDERAAYSRQLMLDARFDSLLDELKNEIYKVEPIQIKPVTKNNHESQAIYALLSDVHYGMCFDGFYGRYNPEIAKQRVMNYAAEIIDIGERNGIDHCYVSLMGDLISGSIHSTIKTENRDHVIAQIIGVSELIATFLYELCKHFVCVHVNNVSGNHSRLEQNPKHALRAERLDALIPWYCQAKLECVSNIEFQSNSYDSTLATFDILGKTYVSVHGDLDDDMKQSSVRLSEMLGKQIDYMLLGHTHVAGCRFEKVGYIKNGAVLSGGDDYTVKKRLFGPAYQVCLICSQNGVDAMFPIRLV